jgi:beta-RFAP synthase
MLESINLTTQSYKSRVDLENQKATIITYPRIHMFSIDLSETTLTGGMGISVPTLPITVCVEESGEDYIDSTLFKEQIKDSLNRLRYLKNIDTHWNVTVKTDIRSHIGLGSETQIVGATLMATSILCGFELKLDEIVQLGTGQVASVGTGLLYKPGFIIELGYKTSYSYMPNSHKHPTVQGLFASPKGSLLRITAPREWNVILAIPKDGQSISGNSEINFWNNILPTSKDVSYKIGYEILMEIIPSLILNDFQGFIRTLDKITAQGTKPNETAIQSEKTKQLLKLFQTRYGFGGISSLGPTLYTVLEHPISTKELKDLETNNNAYIFTSFSLTESTINK